MKFLKLAVLTVVAFVVCWLPYSTCKLLIVVGGTCGGKDVERTLFTLAFLNSLINPFLYFTNLSKHSKVAAAKNVVSATQSNAPGASNTKSSNIPASSQTNQSDSLAIFDMEKATLSEKPFDPKLRDSRRK